MADVRLIVAVGKRGQMGLNGQLPWRDNADLKWFHQQTVKDKYALLVMGGATYDGLVRQQGFDTLAGRNLLVHRRSGTQLRYTRLAGGYGYTDEPCMTPESVIEFCEEKTIWVCGGLQIYKLWAPYVQRFYISRVDYDGPSDVTFPILNFDLIYGNETLEKVL